MFRFSALARRNFLQLGAAGLLTASIEHRAHAEPPVSDTKREPTRFQIACMTLPYSQFPLQRALSGIKQAGYQYVAWGTTHKESGDAKGTPVMPVDAPPSQAQELSRRCRDMGLTPLMMFSEIYPENPRGVEVLTQRFRQAQAAGIPQVLTFGHTKGPNRELWIERFKHLGPIARDHGVLLVVKQHGEAGQLIGEIVREVDHPSVRVNYDAGNVMDYTQGKVNPLEDIQTCAELIHSFCMKDHRMLPTSQDCGPGLGEIDHFRLLSNVAFTGRAMPLCCENIFAPRFRATQQQPSQPDEIDSLARRAREYLELVIRTLQS